MKTDNSKLIGIIERIVVGTSLTKSFARNLEEAILEAYSDADEDDRFEKILHMLASYNPDGGDYLYNEEQLREEIERLLMRLKHSPGKWNESLGVIFTIKRHLLIGAVGLVKGKVRKDGKAMVSWPGTEKMDT